MDVPAAPSSRNEAAPRDVIRAYAASVRATCRAPAPSGRLVAWIWYESAYSTWSGTRACVPPTKELAVLRTSLDDSPRHADVRHGARGGCGGAQTRGRYPPPYHSARELLLCPTRALGKDATRPVPAPIRGRMAAPYVEKHQIAARLTAAVNSVLGTRPDAPYAAMVSHALARGPQARQAGLTAAPRRPLRARLAQQPLACTPAAQANCAAPTVQEHL